MKQHGDVINDNYVISFKIILSFYTNNNNKIVKLINIFIINIFSSPSLHFKLACKEIPSLSMNGRFNCISIYS